MHIKCLGSFFSLLFHFATFNKHHPFFYQFSKRLFRFKFTLRYKDSIFRNKDVQYSQFFYNIFTSSHQEVPRKQSFCIGGKVFFSQITGWRLFTSIQHDFVSVSAKSLQQIVYYSCASFCRRPLGQYFYILEVAYLKIKLASFGNI